MPDISLDPSKLTSQGNNEKNKQDVCPRHQNLQNLQCFIQTATGLSAVFQEASSLHTLKLHHGTMTWVGIRMPQGSPEAEQKPLDPCVHP